MKIYDTFIFYDEFDMLDIRLNYLYDKVDYFVIVEATRTFSGKKKKLYLKQNKELYNKFKNKIIYVKVGDMPNLIKYHNNRYVLENYQRMCIREGLLNCKPDDIIMVSDVDEIPSIECIEQAKELLKDNNILALKQHLFNGHLNEYVNSEWMGTVMTEFNTLNKKAKLNPDFLRDYRDGANFMEGGWHFSNCYDKERIKLKEKHMSGIDKPIEELKTEFVQITKETFPDYLVNNKEKFKHIIKEME